jgi:hypothetical protein
MKKIIVISVSFITLVTFMGFWLLGGFAIPSLLVKSVTAKSGTAKSVWNSFIPSGGITRNGITNFNGFWGFRTGDKVRIWTVSGLKVFKQTVDTKYYFNDVCTAKARESRILYGSTDVNNYSVFKFQDWEKQVSPGAAVEIVVATSSGVIDSLYLSNANFYNKFTGKDLEDLCK